MINAIESPGGPPAHEPAIRVSQISTTDIRGGAARATHRLHRAFTEVGVESRLLVAQRFSADPGIVEFSPFGFLPPAVARALFRLGRRWHRPPVREAGAYFSPDWTLTGWRLAAKVPACDVVNLHWVTDLLDFRALEQLTARVPVVWTLHDMNAFTGGCHYSGTCERYRSRCGACPQLATSKGEDDMTRRILQRKRRVLERISPDRLKIVCPSHWLAGEAQRSSLFRDLEVKVIPNGLNLHDYRPGDPAEMRRRLQLPLDAKVVLFVADSIEDRRKGLSCLLEAVEAVGDIPGLLLVTLGRGGEALPAGPQYRHLGSLEDTEMLRTAYAAADVFAIPSLQDNLPNTVLEAMACGTPVAGFAAGGIGEAIVDEKTGLLAPAGDSFALGVALRRILENPALRDGMARESRLRAEKEYAVRLQALRYAALYADILRTEAVSEKGGGLRREWVPA